MSLTNNDRKIQSHSGNSFPSESFAKAIAGALHREYPVANVSFEAAQLLAANVVLRKAHVEAQTQVAKRTGLRTAQTKSRFLAEFLVCGNVLRAAKSANVGRRTVYNWLAMDERFRRLYEEALDEALDLLEEEARRRAVDGVDTPVYQGGKKVGSIRKYSDSLLIMLLKAKRPETFRERHEHTAKGGAPLYPSPQTMTDAEIHAALMAYAEKVSS